MSGTIGAILTVSIAGAAVAISNYLFRRFGKSEQGATTEDASGEDASSGVREQQDSSVRSTQTTVIAPSNAVRVTTTDDAVTVYSAPDIASQVVARLPNGVDLWLGNPTILEEREWMEATIGSNVGYVLGPTARSHTNLLDPDARLWHLAAQAEPVFDVHLMVSSGSILFPNFCACCGARPSTTIAVRGGMHTIAGVHTKEVQVPYCSFCSGHASDDPRSFVNVFKPQLFEPQQNRPECTTTLRAVKLYVIEYSHLEFTFTSGSYGALFRQANAMKVHQSRR